MADQSTKKPRRQTLTIILHNEDERAVRERLEAELWRGKADGRYPRDMTLSDFALQILRASKAAAGAAQKPRK